jgi:hypothetical protein
MRKRGLAGEAAFDFGVDFDVGVLGVVGVFVVWAMEAEPQVQRRSIIKMGIRCRMAFPY